MPGLAAHIQRKVVELESFRRPAARHCRGGRAEADVDHGVHDGSALDQGLQAPAAVADEVQRGGAEGRAGLRMRAAG